MSEALQGVLSVQVETTSWCNRACAFCPNSTMGKTPDMLMPWETVERIVHGLRELRYAGRVHLFGNGEPLSDDRFMDILRYVRREMPKNHLYISTNGDLAKGDRTIRALMGAGLDELHVSHYDDTNRHLADDEIPGVHHFGLGIMGLEFYNRGGHVKVGSVMNHPRCWWAYGKAFINFRGDWVLCCSDWNGEMIWGNVNEKSLTEIWNGDKFRHYRQTHATGRGKQDLPFCDKCNR